MPHHHGSHAVSIDGLLSWLDQLVEHCKPGQLHHLFEGAGMRRWHEECKRLAENLCDGALPQDEESLEPEEDVPEPQPDMRIVYSPIDQEALQKFLDEVDKKDVELFQKLVPLALGHDDAVAIDQIHKYGFVLTEIAGLMEKKSADLRTLIDDESSWTTDESLYGHSSVAELVEEIPW